MPTRSYYFPRDFSHLETILNNENPERNPASFQIFRTLNIAPLFSGMDIAILLGIGPGLLISILSNQERHYRTFPLTKKDGSKRIISSPRTYLKVIQWWILDNILIKLPASTSAYGFIRGKGIIDNARQHLGSRHFLNIDIKSFFDNVTEGMVRDLYSDIGYNERTSEILARLCCLDQKLPQGAPTSPAIGNQVLKSLDSEIHHYCKSLNLIYTRYADDITISSVTKIDISVLKSVEKKINNAGFYLKREKTRFSGPGDRREVTGLIVSDFIQPPRQWRKNTRAKLHKLSQQAILSEKDVDLLHGISGYCRGFVHSPQMHRLERDSLELLQTKKIFYEEK